MSENQNIHNMLKCDQLVGRLRDRATALFGGKVRIRIVVATLVINMTDFFGTASILVPKSQHLRSAYLVKK